MFIITSSCESLYILIILNYNHNLFSSRMPRVFLEMRLPMNIKLGFRSIVHKDAFPAFAVIFPFSSNFYCYIIPLVIVFSYPSNICLDSPLAAMVIMMPFIIAKDVTNI